MRRLIITFALALLAAGCAVKPPAEHAPPPTADAAQAALQRGDYLDAAREYLRLSEAPELAAPLQQQYRMNAGDAFVRGGQPAKALPLLDGIDEQTLTQDQRVDLRLLRARAWFALRNAEQVLLLLAEPLAPSVPLAAQAEYHQLRAMAYAQYGNHLEAAHDYMRRGDLLTDVAEIADNQQQLWNELSQLSATALNAMRFQPPPDEFSGWMELAEISKQYQLGRRDLQQLLDQWRRNYPQHPALQRFLDEMLQRTTQLLLQPKQIALLLPLSGKFAAAGAAVRDGVMAADYEKPVEQRVAIRIYDVADSALVEQRYDQAVADGADLVIGPLSKEGVAALAARGNLTVPTLALNGLDSAFPPPNLYQFSLAPEEEAKQVAEHAWLLGYTNAAVFAPEGDWGDRIDQAFSERWQELGGKVTTAARYDNAKNDFSRPLRALLNIDLSDLRHSRLETILGEKLEFESRRREDIDFVFLAAFPRQARLIRPQLKFHHAGDLPVLATSHAYSGAFAPELDRDMDGVVIGDMPWTLNANDQDRDLRKKTAVLNLNDNALQRLLAMGIDAYNLIDVLKVLETYPLERFPGETGSLHLDSNRRIGRELSWARFSVGVPRLLTTGNGQTQRR